jgi:hypothetical protein
MNLWWGPPKNFSDRTNERKISWLELFYDLAYVAVISQLTLHLANRPSWNTVGWSHSNAQRKCPAYIIAHALRLRLFVQIEAL